MSVLEPRIIGVRHHSPACARVVRRAIRALRPARVLIEGPADMNGRIEELTLPHELPVAIFSSSSRMRSSPLTTYRTVPFSSRATSRPNGTRLSPGSSTVAR